MNQLDQLRQFTTLVADSGNFRQPARVATQDATPNPLLIVKAVQQPGDAMATEELGGGVRAFASEAARPDSTMESLRK